MANPLKALKAAKEGNNALSELISRAFATRNLLHFAHWNTKSYATHMAVGDLYDQIIDDIDEIVESYQGKFGLLHGLSTPFAMVPGDICTHVKSEADWVEKNRNQISKGDSAIGNLVDTLLGHYHKTVYKLENLG